MSPSSGTALIVDDEESVRDLLSQQLKRLGYDSTAVPNGQEALEQLARQRFDLVLLDVRMPRVTGLEVLWQMRRSDPDTCVVMLSAVVDAEVTASALNMGADDYVTKPSSAGYLRGRIKAAQAHRERIRRGEPQKEVSVAEVTRDLTEQQTALFNLLSGSSTPEAS